MVKESVENCADFYGPCWELLYTASAHTPSIKSQLQDLTQLQESLGNVVYLHAQGQK